MRKRSECSQKNCEIIFAGATPWPSTVELESVFIVVIVDVVIVVAVIVIVVVVVAIMAIVIAVVVVKLLFLDLFATAKPAGLRC